MIKYNCKIDAFGTQYPATFLWDGKNGTVMSEHFGLGHLDNVVAGGSTLNATITMDEHTAKIQLNGLGSNAITGTLSSGWFFSADITGEIVT